MRVWTWMRWMPALPDMIGWLLNCPYTGAWWENELKVLGKWLELPQLLLLTETGFCSACSSANARLDAAMFGEGLVLVTSGDISCFRQSGSACRGSEVVVASGQAGWGSENKRWTWVERQWVSEMSKMKKKTKKSEWLQDGGALVCVWLESACGSKGIS